MENFTSEQVAEDLQLIKKIMTSCANEQRNEGIYFKIWGLLIPLTTIINFLISYNESLHFMEGPIWAVAMAAGGILTIIVSRKRKRNNLSMGVKLQKAIWISCWISIAILYASGFYAQVLKLNVAMMALSILLGNSVFISGTAGGSNLLKIVAFGWWTAGMACGFLSGSAAALLVGMATFILSFIPGVILDNQYKNNLENRA